MQKRRVYIMIILIVLFFLDSNCIKAYSKYEYQNSENSESIEDKIHDIYMQKAQYEDLMGIAGQEEVEINGTNNSMYWWPIGSVETTEVGGRTFASGEPEWISINSPFGMRTLRGQANNHSGIDLGGLRGLGETNIIAARDGIVVYPNSIEGNDCPSRASAEPCHGSGYGNYIIIQHSDGNYTLYGHLYENSITVKAGDSVVQGQVIAKMGSSGNSTGAHLHFEVRIGQNAYSAVVDPINYIDPNDTRPVDSGGDLFEFLNFLEGSTGVKGDKYKVVNIGDGVRTAGHGVTLESNVDRFAQYGINVDDYPKGSYIDISIVDQIEKDVINHHKTYIEGVCASNGVKLKSYQIDALITLMYQAGNIDGFVDAYKKYGETIDLFNNWWQYKGYNSNFKEGVRNRRNNEWKLFTTGKYTTE